MVTVAPPNLLWLAQAWEDVIATAIFAGIVADELHVAPSKHKSFGDNPAGSWPREHQKDRQGPRNQACALDMRMALVDMKRVHNRYKAVFNDITDSRRKYIYAFNGWDGNGSPGRYNLSTMTVAPTDRSHEWHEHVELYYLYVGNDAESWKAARAHLSVVRGWSDAQWLASEMKPEDTVSKAEVIDALDDPVPWVSAGVKSQANARGWGDNISPRALMEYIFAATVLNREDEIRRVVTAILASDDNDIMLTDAQVELFAQRVSAALPQGPTVTEIAKGVNDEAATRLTN